MLALTKEDAARFDISPTTGGAVQAREVEVQGKGGCVVRIPATVRGIVQNEDALSLLYVDVGLGVLTVDGLAGTWRWVVPLAR